MRLLACLLLAAGLAAIEAPTLSRLDATVPVHGYDLAATAPWMPLLWERLALTVPAGAAQYRVTAAFALPAGYGRNATDLLALRDGWRCILDVGALGAPAFSVAGCSGSWSGTVAGTAVLTATFDAAPGAAEVMLLLKQLHYANLGGVRTLDKRRVEIRVGARAGAAWVDSAPLLVDIRPANAEQPPHLRLDDLVIVQGVDQTLVPLAWYAGRAPVEALAWRLLQAPSGLKLLLGENNLAAVQPSAAQPLARMLAGDYVLSAVPPGGNGACTLEIAQGAIACQVRFGVTLVADAGVLVLIGDPPFAFKGPTASFTLRSSRSDVTYGGCDDHPADATGGWTRAPNSITAINGLVTVTFDHPEQPAAGCLVFTAGGQVWRLPYRIAGSGGGSG